MDFAMMYECMHQDEAQSALWSRGSVNLFTAASISNAQSKTYLISTDSKQKDKNSILVFVEYIYENFLHIYDSNQDVQEVIWTDRPSSEFKNKYTIDNLQRLTEKYYKPFTWKFFATSLGKGIVDVVGGNCKYILRQKTFSKGKDRIIVQNAEEFADALSRFVPSTKVAYIDRSTMRKSILKCLLSTLRVPGISKAHMIHCTTHSAELWRNCSYKLDQPDITIHFNTRASESLETKDESAILANHAEGENSDFEVGDWVLVQYDKQKYPGEITDVLIEEVVVSTMHPAGGKCFKWPNCKDECIYPFSTIIVKIHPPEIAGRRRQFSFGYFN